MTLALLAAAALGGTAPATPPAAFREAAPGLEWLTLDGGASCRRGSPVVAALRVDPDRWRLELHHQSESPAATGADAAEWRSRLRSAVVVNAGQYYPDRRPMGLFVADGRSLGGRRLRDWKGLLAAEPAGAPAAARPRITLLDLQVDSFDEKAPGYRTLMQSFMLLDRTGRKRVRRSDWHANRTVLATDRGDRLLVIHTEGAWTLWELADWIARSGLQVRHAMSLDGGFESQMSVKAAAFAYESFGQYHVDDRGDHSMPGLRVKLPAVVSLSAR